MAYMSHSKHYRTGDAVPPPPSSPEVLRVYGMKFCPFVHRLKLVMHAVGADDHETINCNTVQKPEWLFDKNPRGKVPIIEHKNEIIYESDITARYVHSLYGKKSLITEDPLLRAKEEVLLGDLDKGISGFFTYGRAVGEEGRTKGCELMRESFKSLEKFLCDSKRLYIGGDRAGMSDLMNWPFLQRIAIRHRDLVNENSTVKSYYERMLTNDSVKACMHPDQLEAQFWTGYFQGAPEYDIYA